MDTHNFIDLCFYKVVEVLRPKLLSETELDILMGLPLGAPNLVKLISWESNDYFKSIDKTCLVFHNIFS